MVRALPSGRKVKIQAAFTILDPGLFLSELGNERMSRRIYVSALESNM